MSQTQTTITYTDPRYLEGDPFEVASKAVAQAIGAVELAKRALDDAQVMARNAELERQLYATNACDASGWDESPQGKQYAKQDAALANVQKSLHLLRKAAAFNPRKPPKE